MEIGIAKHFLEKGRGDLSFKTSFRGVWGGERTNPSMQATSQAFLTCLRRLSLRRASVRVGSLISGSEGRWPWRGWAPRVCRVGEAWCRVGPACITRINGMKLGEGESHREMFPQGESY